MATILERFSMMSDDRLRMIFGFCLLIGLIGLAALIALGRVEEHLSFGLREIISGILVLSGSFAGYAFGRIAEKNGDKEK